MVDSPVLVVLPTCTKPTYNQQILGRRSPFSPDLEEFRGIPYGVVPGRWQHSHLREKLPLNAYKAWSDGPKCPQLPDLNNSDTWFQSHLEYSPDMKESEIDCLNLFIIRPSTAVLQRIGWNEEKKLPVFIWIHGGGFGFGANTDPMWNPRRLVLQSIALRRPIIAVNINYRLGIFGFAASSAILSAQPTSEIRGCNFGLRDQKVGLAWVSKNISAFGGDPMKITVGGQSAGGGSTYVHVLDAIKRKEKPLFRHACIQSGAIGSTLGPITLVEADYHWETLCQKLGLQETLATSRLDALLAMSTETLLQATRDLNWFVFALVEDKFTMTTTHGDPKHQFSFNLGQVNEESKVSKSENINILIGDTEEEGSIFRHHAQAISNISEIQSLFLESLTSHDTAGKILIEYGLTTEASPAKLTAGLLRFLTDAAFSYPVACARNWFTNRQHLKKSHTTMADDCITYDLQIHHTTRVKSYRIKFGNPFPGIDFGVAQHCAELIYLFDAFHDHMALVDAETAAAEKSEIPISNAALVLKVQQQWISFIVDDQTNNCNESEITVYKRDKSVCTENIETATEWIQQENRFELLASEWNGVLKVLKKITGQVLIGV